MAVLDRFARPLRTLRVSVTDRCNLRCEYCMPEREYVWLPRAEILDFEEIARLVGVFADLGVDRVRLTGGEPLLRRDLPRLVELLARDGRLTDLSLTTNGVLLAGRARVLADAGLHRITVSLDTLRPDRFRALSRSDSLGRVLEGIEDAVRTFPSVKVDSVVVRGVNDDEIEALLEYGDGAGVEVRFIEYMDVGGATHWSPDRVVSRREILDAIEARFGAARPVGGRGSAPAERFELAGGRTFGIVSSMTSPFCGACDRSRLTADGLWYLCLYGMQGIDLRAPLRAGASAEELRERIRSGWRARADRGAEERRARETRGALFTVDELRNDPHREMHTRGG